MDKVKVAVLGATGLVGQRFLDLLAGHPMFEVVAVTASPRSVGKRYKDATRWMLGPSLPEPLGDLEVLETSPKALRGCGCEVDLVFSALPSSIAREVEPELAKEGFKVVSNASALRMLDDVPLVIPEVNPEHLKLIEVQQERRGWRGFVVTSPNCSTSILTLTLKPLMDHIGIKEVHVTTMQAVSGAGYSGVPSMAIVDNVIPFISGEEEKLQREPLKILGKLSDDHVEKAELKVLASCNRVCVVDGHLESVFLRPSRKVEVEEVKKVLEGFEGVPQQLKLPLAPVKPVVVRDEEDRPQPRLDRVVERGMAVVVGRIRCSEEWIRYMVLGNNVVRGAAGNAILIGELLVKMGRV
ncbi:MAG: aspartate-semialdehyde dehydrogenase [Thermoprotei archaeon]|nr:MAG: aspartate-semialdehyde dehydrogenase [Thermoprotei archaeon]